MAPTAATYPPAANDDSSLPTAAIVFIVIGAYIIVFIIAVLIRQCLQARGLNICPEWVNEMCCLSCCCSCQCITHFAEMCDFNVPTKNSCMDSCCPTKEWCDDNLCCCMNAAPGGDLCGDCEGPECQCGDCNCNCNCNLPECNTINCICFEIQLTQPTAGTNMQGRGQPGQQGQNPGPNVGYSGNPTYPHGNTGYA